MNTDNPANQGDNLPPPPPGQQAVPWKNPRAVQVELASLTHKGLVRESNEDRYLTIRAGRFMTRIATNLEEGCVPNQFENILHVMIVADGMGGMAGGEIASRLAISTLIDLVLDTPDWIFSHEELEIEEILRRATRRFGTVNAAVMSQAWHNPALTGMGSTLTVAWNHDTDLFIAHIGDSRCYLYRHGVLHQLTRDHTLAQALADQGKIKHEEIATHRLRHVLTHAIGSELGGEPILNRLTLEDGDRVLLCTDGLTEMVPAADIAAQLSSDEPVTVVCQALVDLALKRGGKDNVTVIVAQYRMPQESQ